MLTHIWLIRHAKSSWRQVGLSDFERPLNARGERDAPRMRDWLREQPNPAQWIYTSDAARARATAGFVHDAWPDAELVEDHRLYGAGPRDILSLAEECPVERVALVAHNPGMTWAINELDPDKAIENLPTFGVACFDLTGDAPVQISFMSPKRLPV